MNSLIGWVLLIDDDDVQNFLHKRIIQSYISENQIFVATNGEEALKILNQQIEKNAPLTKGIILIDINMPIMNGFQFVENFNIDFAHLLPNTAIFPLTSSNEIQDVLQMTRLGIENYIVKPLTHEYADRLFGLEK
jgi:response regulator of citrate/malate metabolism